MCLNPLKGFLNDKNEVIKVANKNAEFVRYEKGIIKTYYDSNLALPSDFTLYIDIPCRACEECYGDMRRAWIARATAEMQLHDKAMFVTFTYKDFNDGNEVLPPVAQMISDDGEILNHQTLRYRDFQLFMKRLRKYFPDRNIRFMVCGEYGSRTFRPHYHAILYGIGLDDFPDMLVHNKNKSGDLLYSSISLDNLWRLGYTLSSNADNGTIAYVAGYVAKKFTSMRSKDFYAYSNVVAPFIRSSNRPGLGAAWFNENMELYENEYDYRVISASNTRSNPTYIYLTSNWKRLYLNKRFNDATLTDINDYLSYKVKRRVDLIDNRFRLLKTDKSKDDYNIAERYNFRKRLERKRGVY